MGRKKSAKLVKVTQHGERAFDMYFDNPITGKREWRTTGCTSRDDALAKAGEWAAEIRSGRCIPDSNILWKDFRQTFQDDHLHDGSSKTFAAYVSAFNAIERHAKIGKLAELSAERIRHVVREFHKEKLSRETIRTYLRHLRAALNWAKRHELLDRVPEIAMPKRIKGQKMMKGRAITGEEFERMLAKVEAGIVLANVKPTAKRKRKPATATIQRMQDAAAVIAPKWRRFLRGLWWSGLRLGEAISLSWNDERFITVDMTGPQPRLRIAAGQDKSQEARLLPLAPEFAKGLRRTPKGRRRGAVFALPGLAGGRVTSLQYISSVVSCIGEAAGVRVEARAGGAVKFASAHDLRRAFGARWASRVMPAVLKELMRHDDIATTMRYYAEQDVAAVEKVVYAEADKVGKKVGKSIGKTRSKSDRKR